MSLAKLKDEAKKLKGKAPIPNEICRPSRPMPFRNVYLK
jgi:hypothetical protein